MLLAETLNASLEFDGVAY